MSIRWNRFLAHLNKKLLSKKCALATIQMRSLMYVRIDNIHESLSNKLGHTFCILFPLLFHRMRQIGFLGSAFHLQCQGQNNI